MNQATISTKDGSIIINMHQTDPPPEEPFGGGYQWVTFEAKDPPHIEAGQLARIRLRLRAAIPDEKDAAE